MARPQIKLDQGQALPTRMPEAVTTEPHSHPWASPIHQNNSGEVLVAQLCLTLCDPMDCNAFQASLSMGFSRQDYWSVLPFLPPGDFPNLGIKPTSPVVVGLGFKFISNLTPSLILQLLY